MPISPSEVAEKKSANTPKWVFDVWDKLIVEKYQNGRAYVLQKDAKAALLDHPECPDGVDIFRTGWLDIEPAYREAGWKVEYDKPAYYEDYEASFTFTKP